MAHYAFLDENNIVIEVIVGKDEGTDGIDWEQKYGEIKGQTCKRTSYNTYGNTHKDGGTPFRGNYAGIGYTYETENDVFYPPQPYPSWTIDPTDWEWKPPVTHPNVLDSSDTHPYVWNEATLEWL